MFQERENLAWLDLLTSFHNTKAELENNSSKITTKPDFVRAIDC